MNMRYYFIYAALLLFVGSSHAESSINNEQRMVEDWMIQDVGRKNIKRCFVDQSGHKFEKSMVEATLSEAPDDKFKLRLEELVSSNAPGNDPEWKKLYIEASRKRRAKRLEGLLGKWKKIVFTKHYNIGGSHYAYTEGLSDAQKECHFIPGSALCVLTLDGKKGRVETLLKDEGGVIRDPDVSYDEKKILFAWKKSLDKDDYHLYEMDVKTRKIRQLTFGLGFADYEGIYLPDGNIMFNSTRCVQTVDCWWTEVSNIYVCDKNGKLIRRFGFDQVHSNYPQVLNDGRVIYTRWEYSDRGQIFPQSLFQMNMDGTAQTEFYGNNSYFPTAILHARPIAGSSKVVAIASGHHTHQRGKLCIIDRTKGTQEAQGVQLVAPVRETKAVKVDVYGQSGQQFQYPYAINEKEFIVTMVVRVAAKKQRWQPFGLYYIDKDGRRELLVSDTKISCNQPVPLAARGKPVVRPSMVDYKKKTGTFYVQDIYYGPGLKGVKRGTIDRIRVVEIRHRAAGIGSNRNMGKAGGALASTPVSTGGGCWDVKVVIGDAKVYEDGSAFFTVPARTPVYFQALDKKGHMVQTMRSWSTLMPGENFSCVGCHEDKNEAPSNKGGSTMAMKAGSQNLKQFYGAPRGFSFSKEIQPILNAHCIKCHDGGKGEKKSFSLKSNPVEDKCAKRNWSASYLALTGSKPFSDKVRKNVMMGDSSREIINWPSIQSAPPMLPPYHAGAARSKLITILEKHHGKTKLNQEEMDKIACWIDLLVPFCGDYMEANAWTDEEVAMYKHFMKKRGKMEKVDQQSIKALAAEQGR